VFELQPPAQPHRGVAVECPIRLADGAYLKQFSHFSVHTGLARRLSRRATFFVVQSWAGYITNMPEFNLRQAQVLARVPITRLPSL
jgi:hypothetical protein